MFGRDMGAVLPVLIILITLSFGGYFVYSTYTEVQQQKIETQLKLAQLDAERAKLRLALSKIHGISSLAIENGFWYSYKDTDGNESVFYFNLDEAAADNISDAQIASLAAHLASSTILHEGSIATVTDSQLPSNLQFHNSIYSSAISGTSTLEIAKRLAAKVKSPQVTSDELLQLSYLDELAGDYAGRDALNKQNCTQFKIRCDSPVQVIIKGKVVDGSGVPVEGVTVDIVSRPDSVAVTTGPDGTYALKSTAKEMEKMRIHIHKRNYSDGYADVVVLTGEQTRTFALDDVQITSPISIVTVDFAHHSVTGNQNTFNTDGSITVKTSRSTYLIPHGAIVHADGTAYTGDSADIYLYEFSKGNPPPSLTQLDTFDAVRGYAGDLMKSFGMPYIQFFAPNGEELHVLSSNPMTLTYRIADMDALRNNTDHIYRALTDADMKFLVSASAGQPLRINRQFLIDNDMLQFPAFWVFDRRRAVWDNVGVSVLDTQGTIQTIFYTIRVDT